MTKNQKMMLDLLKEEKTINEIRNNLKIEDKDLIKLLKSLEENGYSAVKEYYANGEIKLSLNKKTMLMPIAINEVKDSIKIGVIAENHFGSKRERIDYLDMATEYFTKANIHYVINGGDLIDGVDNSKYQKIEQEVKYALKKYPKSQSTTFLVLGDHDIKPLLEEGYDMAKVIEKNRLDLIPIGFQRGQIEIGKDKIEVYHKRIKNKKSIYESKIILLAHAHKSGCEMIENNLKIYIPPLSDIIIQNFAPGFLILYLQLDNTQNIEKVWVQRMIFNPHPLIATEDHFSFVKK